jgi:hypothetical protein
MANNHKGQTPLNWCIEHDSQIPNALAPPNKFWPCFKAMITTPRGDKNGKFNCVIEDPPKHWQDIDG